MTNMRKETDSLGVVEVPADKLWGAQTQRSLEHFSIGKDLIPREMITAYAILKKAAAAANHASKRLDDQPYKLIVQTCDEILADQHHDMFPLHVWMTGSGTQFNMNVNEVISNRCCQLAGTPLGSKTPVHPNDHVNMAQSSNDSFPSAMYIAAAVNVRQRLIPAVTALHDAIDTKAQAWRDIVKIGRTHMQDATPLTLGQEWSGYAGMLADDLERIETALQGVYRLALGGSLWNNGCKRHLIHIDAVYADIDKDYRPQLELTGSIAATLQVLAAQVDRQTFPADDKLLGEIARDRAKFAEHAATLNGVPIHPMRLVHELQSLLSDDMTLCLDMGSFHIWLARHLYSFRARQILMTNGQQTLGVGLPWAVGACLVRPGEKVISISGDGGFLFSAMELETAVRLKCNLVHLVWIDGAYDMVRFQEMSKYGRDSGVEFGPVDIVQFAEAFGASGLKIDTPDQIAPTLKRALAMHGPVVVGIPVDYRDNHRLMEMVHPNVLN